PASLRPYTKYPRPLCDKKIVPTPRGAPESFHLPSTGTARPAPSVSPGWAAFRFPTSIPPETIPTVSPPPPAALNAAPCVPPPKRRLFLHNPALSSPLLSV